MSGLVLKLSPKERVIINGAVIENGPRRSRFTIVTPNVNILRLRDAIHPENSKTPVGHICYRMQLVLTGDLSIDNEREHITDLISNLLDVFTSESHRDTLLKIKNSIKKNNVYTALKLAKSLLPIEDFLLNGLLKS